MATRHHLEAAVEETELIRPEPIVPDESSQVGAEWPVAREYRVAADENGGIPVPYDEVGELVVTAPPRSRRVPLYIGAGLLGALVAVLLLVGGAWLLSRGEESGQTTQTSPAPAAALKPKKQAAASVAVPDVTSLEVTRARTVLEDARLAVRIQSVSVSDTATPDEVLRQTPGAGTDVAAGTVVVLTVPSGEARTQVPEVIGLMASHATRALRAEGLRAEIRLVRSTRPAGTVLDQTPAPDTEVASKSVVRLEVAKASPPVTIAVPRVVGSTAAEAKSSLRGLGLRWTVTRVESSKLEGTVVRQSPRVGSRLRKGQAVTLEVSTGPAQVTVPDVTGLDEQSARAQLEAAGFAVQVTDEVTTDPGQDGLVIRQAPGGGSTSEKAGTVMLTVARLG